MQYVWIGVTVVDCKRSTWPRPSGQKHDDEDHEQFGGLSDQVGTTITFQLERSNCAHDQDRFAHCRVVSASRRYCKGCRGSFSDVAP